MTPINNVKELRQIFRDEHPHLNFSKIKDYSGNGKMYCTDTRCAFVDFVDYMRSSGRIPQRLAKSATL